MSTAVPEPTFGPLGFQAPAEADILAGVLADYQAAFGGNLNPNLETPQGQLITSETAIIGNKNDQFLALAQSFDPAFASGRAQDALGRIYFLTRDPARPTTVVATLSGLTGVVIPVGTLAQDVNGNIYASTLPGTIGAGGTVDIPFSNNATGPIPCPTGALDTIYRAISGWDSITNASDGVLGNDVESRAAFEERRQQSVAKNGLGFLSAVRGEVLDVPNVLDAYVTENPTASPVTIGGFTLVPNSLYVAAAGGVAADIAHAIWTKKAPGCAYNGNTTVTVLDTNSGYELPYPSYSVTFEIPAALPIHFAVVIKNSTLVPSDAVAQIQAAIILAFVGGDGGPRARIGSLIFASRFYAPIAALGPWAQIVSVLIGLTSVPVSPDIQVGIAQVPTIDVANIAVSLV